MKKYMNLHEIYMNLEIGTLSYKWMQSIGHVHPQVPPIFALYKCD